MRLLRGHDSWWCLHGSKIARLPLDAVSTDDPDQPDRPVLVEAARTALRQGGFLAERPRDGYSLTVLTSTRCNLGCGYCFQNVEFADDGNPAPDRIPAAHLSPRTIDDILAFTDRMMGTAGFTKLKVLLFGGEPLLNRTGCLTLLRRAREHGMTSAAMVSNGVLLTARTAGELVDAGLRATQITFDGDRDTHDLIRATRNGRGTFDQILRNIADVSAAVGMAWQFRVNVSHRNAHTVPGLLDRLARHVEPSTAGMHIALVDDVGIGYDNRLRHSADLARQVVGWYRHALDLGFRPRPPRAGFHCEFCTIRSGRTGAVVNADGTLYSCWETVGKADMAVGHVRSGYLAPAELTPRWVTCTYNAAEHGTPEETASFHDAVDAALLDELAARGALPHRRSLPGPAASGAAARPGRRTRVATWNPARPWTGR
ncbi:radical SAM protein [Saccharothrix australiensis]|uniref:Radical SAM core domain-containing protein n=1 Tax=Saccharothrix australiensis TaxID=2072 RepID=A0A495VW72_9PSEU|nr:radical SAM protein [Saccharothrix australiensis]RKT53671.1 uncharacterized protein C8E97_2250 [Saccharothrix australiensis]